jgi:hypothetical protein
VERGTLTTSSIPLFVCTDRCALWSTPAVSACGRPARRVPLHALPSAPFLARPLPGLAQRLQDSPSSVLALAAAHVATPCNVSQRAAQHVATVSATPCNVSQRAAQHVATVSATPCNVSQRDAQHVATVSAAPCNVSQRDAQHVATVSAAPCSAPCKQESSTKPHAELQVAGAGAAPGKSDLTARGCRRRRLVFSAAAVPAATRRA